MKEPSSLDRLMLKLPNGLENRRANHILLQFIARQLIRPVAANLIKN
jgi:hypothetical protein